MVNTTAVIYVGKTSHQNRRDHVAFCLVVVLIIILSLLLNYNMIRSHKPTLIQYTRSHSIECLVVMLGVVILSEPLAKNYG